MSVRWVITLALLFLGLTIISGIVEDTYLGDGAISTLDTLLRPNIPVVDNPIEGTWAWVSVGKNFVEAIWTMLWFDYAQFQGAWRILAWFFRCISIGFIWGIIQWARGVAA